MKESSILKISKPSKRTGLFLPERQNVYPSPSGKKEVIIIIGFQNYLNFADKIFLQAAYII